MTAGDIVLMQSLMMQVKQALSLLFKQQRYLNWLTKGDVASLLFRSVMEGMDEFCFGHLKAVFDYGHGAKVTLMNV